MGIAEKISRALLQPANVERDARYLRKHSSLSQSESQRVAETIHRCFRGRVLTSFMIEFCILVGWGCLILLDTPVSRAAGQLLKAVAKIEHDPSQMSLSLLITLFSILVVPLSLTTLTRWHLWKRPMRRLFREITVRPICIWCSYDCSGVLTRDNIFSCPECGEESPCIIEHNEASPSDSLG